MRDRGFGSILVSDADQALIGIFTERDLLKWIDEIQHGAHWGKPVSVLMSRPVVTLSVNELDSAADVMIERNIRHLPVVYDDPVSGQALTGVISMRDLLKETVAKNKAKESAPKRLRAGMISKNESIRHLIRKVCARQGDAMVENIPVEGDRQVDLGMLGELDYLFFDLDGIQASIWVGLLRELNATKGHPDVLLFYDPDKHSGKELDVLSKLSLSKHFTAYMKPINIFAISRRIS